MSSSASYVIGQRTAQQVQELMGERGQTRALLVKKVSTGTKRITQKSKPVSAAPTMDDYNALVADIAAILTILNG